MGLDEGKLTLSFTVNPGEAEILILIAWLLSIARSGKDDYPPLESLKGISGIFRHLLELLQEVLGGIEEGKLPSGEWDDWLLDVLSLPPFTKEDRPNL